MAAVAESSLDDAVQCMICLEYSPHLEDPKRLPCTHILCRECLTNLANVSKKDFPCPTCRSITEGKIDSLPSALSTQKKTLVSAKAENVPDEPHVLCHVCLKKNKKSDTKADMFCHTCNDVFCDRHAGFHFELFEDHKVVEIAEYNQQAKKLEKRFCSDHTLMELSLACSACHVAICMECLPHKTHGCLSGQVHKYMALDKLSNQLIGQLDKLRAEAQQKESEADKLVKDTMNEVDQWQQGTKELIDQLHEARAKQIARVNAEYAELEKEIIIRRESGKGALENFLEQQLVVKHSEIVRKLQINDANLKDYHQVDYVDKFNEDAEFLRAIAEDPSPYFVYEDDVKLNLTVNHVPSMYDRPTDLLKFKYSYKKDVKADVELVASSKSIGEQVTRGPPTGLKLIRKITTYGCGISVCHHRGLTYVGLEDGFIVRIDRDWKPQIHIDVGGKVMAIVAHQDRLYCLIHYQSNQSSIVVYNVLGNHITSWNHPAITGFRGSHMSLIEVPEERLVVGNQSGKQLIIYTLTGKIIKKIPYPGPIGLHFVIASCEFGNCIITESSSNSAKRICVEDGKVSWVIDSLSEPRGLAVKDQYLLVSSAGFPISVVDITNGKVLHQIADVETSGSYSLCVYGDTLVVPRASQKTVLFYQLIYD